MDLIFIEDVENTFPDESPQSIRDVLSSLTRKGYIYRVKRGLYLRCELPHKPVIANPGKLALAIYDGYLAFSSALHHWGLIEYEPFTIFVATRSKGGKRNVGEYTFQAVSIGKKAAGMVYDNGVYVSSLEKTLFDCIYKPQHAGGYALVARAIEDAKPDWNELGHWLEKLGTESLRRRGGYLLSKTKNAPKWLLKRVMPKEGTKVWLDPSGKRKGKYAKRWCVIDNVGI